MKMLINKKLTIENTFDSVERLDFNMKLPYLPKKIKELIDSDTIQDYFMIGYLFDIGIPEENMSPDTNQAIFWYNKAAFLGHIIAKLNLGVLYDTGHKGNITPNYHMAADWYSAAVSSGNIKASFYMGRLFWTGKGVNKSLYQAYRQFKIAAKAGNVMSMSNIGVMYMSGTGVERNYTLALLWLSRAALEDCCASHHNLGIMYENGWGVTRDMERANNHFHRSHIGNSHPVSPNRSQNLRKFREPVVFI